MENESMLISRKYFAAANSYRGFVSYFDSIFNPKEYEKIYILKGGPGTGKNSFMKALRDRFLTYGLEIEEIYCSSDPKSLDGIILEHQGKKVAVIDGTSPHERDPKLPGAVDAITNLGENWDSRWLVGNKEKIILLNEEKRKAYSTAYEYLKMGKAAFDYKTSVQSEVFNTAGAEKSARSLIKSIKSSKSYKSTTRLISAFGKNGLITLNTMDFLAQTQVKIGGETSDALLFMDVLKKVAQEKRLKHQISPYPLAPEFSEAIFFPQEKLCIRISGEAADIDASHFKKGTKSADSERVKKAIFILKEAEGEAIRWFSIASDLHFRLEDIYTSAMTFEENNRVLEKVASEIEIIFDKIK